MWSVWSVESTFCSRPAQVLGKDHEGCLDEVADNYDARIPPLRRPHCEEVFEQADNPNLPK